VVSGVSDHGVLLVESGDHVGVVVVLVSEEESDFHLEAPKNGMRRWAAG